MVKVGWGAREGIIPMSCVCVCVQACLPVHVHVKSPPQCGHRMMEDGSVKILDDALSGWRLPCIELDSLAELPPPIPIPITKPLPSPHSPTLLLLPSTPPPLSISLSLALSCVAPLSL